MYEELRTEAALLIQKCWRRHVQLSQAHSDSCCPEVEQCRLREKDFSGNSDDVDSCDRCAAPHHAYCLHSIQHPKANYADCKQCLREDDDIEGMPTFFEKSDPGNHSTSESIPSEAEGRQEEASKRLDTTLNYIGSL